MKLHEHFDVFKGSVNLNPNRLDQLADHEKALTGWLREDSGIRPDHGGCQPPGLVGASDDYQAVAGAGVRR